MQLTLTLQIWWLNNMVDLKNTDFILLDGTTCHGIIELVKHYVDIGLKEYLKNKEAEIDNVLKPEKENG